MPKVKAIKKFVPQTAYPRNPAATRKIMVEAGITPEKLVELIRKRNSDLGQTYYSGMWKRLDSGTYTLDNMETYWEKTYVASAYYYAFPSTEKFEQINNAFLAEYDSRTDLQDLYKIGAQHRYILRTLNGEYINIDTERPQYKERPESYRMFEEVVKHTESAKKMAELGRNTPYREGDLVLLRSTFVDNMDYDPMFIPYWQADERGETPDKTVPRIGTVISVTEKIDGYRVSKGSKIIKIVWMGVGEGKIYDMPEKCLKWHQRPSYANGMKVRE